MREALARSDLDVVAYGSAPDRKGGTIARIPKVLRSAAIGTGFIVCGVIVVNALFLQDRKHAAPLIHLPKAQAPAEAQPAPMPAPRPAAAVAPASAPAPSVARPAARDSKADPIGDEISRLSTPSAAPASDKKGRDPIAALIGNPATAAAPASHPSESVRTAQKALMKLGYVVRPNGVIDAATRQAVERYQKDNKLQVKGELTPKLMKELAAKAGMAMP